MRLLAAALVLAACGGATEVVRDFRVTIHVHKEGIKVYSGGEFLGLSPVVVTRRLVSRELDGGVRRWFVDGKEVFAGGHWTLPVETFREGVRVSTTARVPFDPERPDTEVRLDP